MKNVFMKLSVFLLCMTMLLTVAPIGFVHDAEASVAEVYVSNRYGSDENEGTLSSPFKTLKKAVNTIGLDKDGTINILDKWGETDNNGDPVVRVFVRASGSSPYKYGGTNDHLFYDVPAHTGTITYRGYKSPNDTSSLAASDAVIGYSSSGGDLRVKGPTVFEDITLVDGYNYYKDLMLSGHDVTLRGDLKHLRTGYHPEGEFETVNAGVSSDKIRITDVINGGTTDGGRVNIESGTYHNVYFVSSASTVTAPHTIAIDGESANLFRIYLFGSDKSNVDVLSIVYNKGYLSRVESSVSNSGGSVNAIQYVLNNGKTLEITNSAKEVSPKLGTWIMKSADTSGNRLDVTDTAGKFRVIGGKAAIATNSGGSTYVSNDGILSVPAGEYNITYIDVSDISSVVFTFDGVAQDPVMSGTSIALPRLSARPGKNFVGWTLDGSTIFNDSYTVGMYDGYLAFVSVWDVYDDTYIVYVDEAKGSASADGLSELTAFDSIDDAIRKADAAEESNKLVVVIGDYNLTSLAAHKSMITITSDGTARLLKTTTVEINGPTTFENIEFYNLANSKFLDTRGHKLVLGDNVDFVGGTSGSTTYSRYLYIHLGSENTDDGQRESIVMNSSVTGLRVGTFYNKQQRDFPGADIVVNAKVNTISLFPDGYGSGDNRRDYPCVYTKPVNITIGEGGTVGRATTYDGKVIYDSAVHFIVNGGTLDTVDTAIPNVWIMHTHNTTGSEYITASTEKEGYFTVHGTKTARAADRHGNIYYSTDGKLVLPAGTYDVTFENSLPRADYTNSGFVIEVINDTEIDLGTIKHNEIKGKLFVGWRDSEGNYPTGTKFAEGDILTAQYREFDVASMFYIEGAQIRTSGKHGLRFVVRKNNSVDSIIPGITSFGSAVLPSYYLHDYEKNIEKELLLDTDYNYFGRTYNAAEVEAEKIFETLEDSVRYTVCITDIPDDEIMYTVRGYIRYEDLNGVERTLYTDYYATRNLNVAAAALNDPEKDTKYTADEQSYFSSMISDAKKAVAEYYNTDRTTLGGSPDAENEYTYVYELEGSGLQVREADIIPFDYEKGVTEREPVTIVQVTDTHLNYANEQDYDEDIDAIMASIRGTTAFPECKSLPATINALRYAYSADAIAVTGDILNYFSRGSMELTKKYIFDVYPEVLAVLGNHDASRVNEQDVSVPQQDNADDRAAILSEIWNSDVYYTSKIIKDRVMIIGLDNGLLYNGKTAKFHASQKELLEADLKKARDSGYTVLLFYHIPLATANPEETSVLNLPGGVTAVPPIPVNFCDGTRNGKTACLVGNEDSATAAVMELIKNNGDIIRGMFCGHFHDPYYTEFMAKAPIFDDSGNITGYEDVKIPQYVMTRSADEKGSATKITVY